MRVAVKDKLVIKSAAPYCSKLTTRKLLNTAKKKKQLHQCAKLAQNMLLFFHQMMGRNHFLQTVQYTEKNINTQRYTKQT